MKRSQIVFVTVVFTALLTGILVERAHRNDPFEELALRPPRSVPLDPLVIPRGPHTLAGRIITQEAADRERVLIHLRPQEDEEGDVVRPILWAVTDAGGRFRLDGLPEGLYVAEILQRGHENTTVEIEVPSQREVAWTLGEPRPPLEVLPDLERASLSGVVRDRAGNPLSGYEIVLRPEEETSMLSGALVRRAESNAEGRFVFRELALGRYRAELLPAWAKSGSWPVLVTEEIDHRDPVSGRPLVFTFTPGRIGGRLIDQNTRPVEGALVQMWPLGEEKRLWPTTTSGAGGTFLLGGLPSGTFVLRIRAGAAVVEREVLVRAGERVDLNLPPIQPGLQDGR